MPTLKRCLNCNKIFDRPFRSRNSPFKISWTDYKKRKFCSLKCKNEYQSRIMRGENNPNWKGGTFCIDCGKRLSSSYPKSRKPLRCRECWKKFIKENPQFHPHWKGGKPKCIFCNKSVGDYQSIMCIECYRKYRKFFIPRGSKHYNWKGNNVSYKALHDWVNKNFGKPTRCEFCGKTSNQTRLHWANKSGKYLRDRKDWLMLCPSCHRLYDLQRTIS